MNQAKENKNLEEFIKESSEMIAREVDELLKSKDFSDVLNTCVDHCEDFIDVLNLLSRLFKTVHSNPRTFSHYSLLSILDRLHFDSLDAQLHCIHECQNLTAKTVKSIEHSMKIIYRHVKDVLEELRDFTKSKLSKVDPNLSHYVTFPTPLSDIGEIPQLTRCLMKRE